MPFFKKRIFVKKVKKCKAWQKSLGIPENTGFGLERNNVFIIFEVR